MKYLLLFLFFQLPLTANAMSSIEFVYDEKSKLEHEDSYIVMKNSPIRYFDVSEKIECKEVEYTFRVLTNFTGIEVLGSEYSKDFSGGSRGNPRFGDLPYYKHSCKISFEQDLRVEEQVLFEVSRGNTQNLRDQCFQEAQKLTENNSNIFFIHVRKGWMNRQFSCNARVILK